MAAKKKTSTFCLVRLAKDDELVVINIDQVIGKAGKDELVAGMCVDCNSGKSKQEKSVQGTILVIGRNLQLQLSIGSMFQGLWKFASNKRPS